MEAKRMMFTRPRLILSNRQLEWIGSATGLAGSALLAARIPASGYGFLIFLISNTVWLVFSLRSRLWGMLLMQVGFTVTSLIGLWRWIG